MSSTSVTLTSRSTSLSNLSSRNASSQSSAATQPTTHGGSQPSALNAGARQPQTPQSASQSALRPSYQPGTWRHPQMDAITRRQNRTVFSSADASFAVKNAIYFLVSIVSPPLTSALSPDFLSRAFSDLAPLYANAIFAIRMFFLLNFLYAFRPFIQPKDEIDDVPLTPSQRALLGLKPSSTPLTPGSQVVTPPRYTRSATPKSSASDRAVSGSPLTGSPLAGRGRSASMERSISGRGSPYGGSPLVREALTGSAGRRLSFGIGGGEGGSSSSGMPSTPMPVVGTGRASVGLNNKWLYQHGKGSPSGRSLFN